MTQRGVYCAARLLLASYNRSVREDQHVAKDKGPKKEVKKPKKKK
jgi:hypothetical protein